MTPPAPRVGPPTGRPATPDASPPRPVAPARGAAGATRQRLRRLPVRQVADEAEAVAAVLPDEGRQAERQHQDGDPQQEGQRRRVPRQAGELDQERGAQLEGEDLQELHEDGPQERPLPEAVPPLGLGQRPAHEGQRGDHQEDVDQRQAHQQLEAQQGGGDEVDQQRHQLGDHRRRGAAPRPSPAAPGGRRGRARRGRCSPRWPACPTRGWC